MKKMFLIMRYDFLYGVVKHLWKVAILGVVALFAGSRFLTQAMHLMDSGIINECPSYLETLFYVFKGLEPLKDNMTDFQLPILYSFLFIGFSIITGDYVTKDLEGFGQNIIAYSGSRKSWIISKIIWNFVMVVTFFFTTFLGVFIAYIVKAPEKSYLCVHKSVIRKMFHMGMTDISSKRVLISIGLMIIAMFVISLIQMTVAYMTSPTLGFSFIVINILIACSKMSSYLIGNYTMLIRGYELSNRALLILPVLWCVNIIFLLVISDKKNLLCKV